jgi:hypothetical protein
MAQPLPFCEDKIYLEPDLGDPRKSTFKALPAPPKTPKRVMRKYRFSAVFPLVFVLASFVLSLVVVLAGRDKGIFDGQYLLAVSHERIDQICRLLTGSSSTHRELDRMSLHLSGQLRRLQHRLQLRPQQPIRWTRSIRSQLVVR